MTTIIDVGRSTIVHQVNSTQTHTHQGTPKLPLIMPNYENLSPPYVAGALLVLLHPCSPNSCGPSTQMAGKINPLEVVPNPLGDWLSHGPSACDLDL